MKTPLVFIVTFLALLSAQTVNAEIIAFTGISGSSGSVSQAITGGTVTTTWGGNFNGGATSNASLGFVNRQVGPGLNFATITFTADAGFETDAFFELLSQRDHTGSNTSRGDESGILVADGSWTITAQSGLSALSGSGSNTLMYGNIGGADQRGSFDANFNGTILTYMYSVLQVPEDEDGQLTDPFRLEVTTTPIVVAVTVPEPSSFVLFGVGGLVLIAGRKRS